MKFTPCLTALLVSGFMAGIAVNVRAEDNSAKEKAEQAKLQAEAKLGRGEAEKVALDKVPGGRVKEAELENEDGKLVWSIDCVTPGTRDITEVLVDAKTGAIVSIEKETPGDEAQEEVEAKGKKDKEEDDDKD
jgi:uncharacterized membrane protein YkoI